MKGKLILVLLLSILMILILTSCSSTPQEKIVGQWEIDYSMYNANDIFNFDFTSDGHVTMYSSYDYKIHRGHYIIKDTKLILTFEDRIDEEVFICSFRGDKMFMGNYDLEYVRVYDSDFTHGKIV